MTRGERASRVGLRVDVCTYRGLRDGVPRLLTLLARLDLRATFFVTLGPDHSGRAVWRFFRERGFLAKMLRTRALSMYGWRTALYGTLLPAPQIGRRCADIVRQVVEQGHELGVHAWDHVTWQDRLDRLPGGRIEEDYRRAVETCRRITGEAPRCTAAPAWLSNARSLLAAARWGFDYGADARGRCPFLPLVEGRVVDLPQIPTTLPTLDEVIGREGRAADDFVDLVLRSVLSGTGTEVFTAHAAAEGRAYSGTFEDLLQRLLEAGVEVVPLAKILDAAERPLPICAVSRGRVPGRAGAVTLQGEVVARDTL